MLVKEIMSRPVATIPATARLSEAAQLMWDFDCGAIPVPDIGGRLTGIVTDRDICMAAYTKARRSVRFRSRTS